MSELVKNTEEDGIEIEFINKFKLLGSYINGEVHSPFYNLKNHTTDEKEGIDKDFNDDFMMAWIGDYLPLSTESYKYFDEKNKKQCTLECFKQILKLKVTALTVGSIISNYQCDGSEFTIDLLKEILVQLEAEESEEAEEFESNDAIEFVKEFVKGEA